MRHQQRREKCLNCDLCDFEIKMIFAVVWRRDTVYRVSAPQKNPKILKILQIIIQTFVQLNTLFTKQYQSIHVVGDDTNNDMY